MSRWRAALAGVKRRQHQPLARFSLDLAQDAYALFARFAADCDRPACAGGWPARVVPLPAPRPFGPRERREVLRVLRAQDASAFDGSTVRRFEEELALRTGARHAVAVSSGTAALHAAMIAAGVGPGDEVICPALTYVSSALAALYQGAIVRFVDVDPASWTIDPSALAAAIGPRTRAVVAVHLCGVPADLDSVLAITRAHGLALIEDAAQAHGATWRGRHVGTQGDFGCFSFQSAKTISTGEGGAVLCREDEHARRVRLAANLGESTGDGAPTLGERGIGTGAALEYRSLGWNYRLGALQAALGLAQLSRWDEIVEARIVNARRLALGLAEEIERGRCTPQSVPAAAQACPSSWFLRLAPELAEGRARIVAALAAERIDVRLPYDRSLAAHPIFRAPGRFPAAEAVCRETFGLRTDPALRARDVASIVLAVGRNLAHATTAPRSAATARATVSSNGRGA